MEGEGCGSFSEEAGGKGEAELPGTGVEFEAVGEKEEIVDEGGGELEGADAEGVRFDLSWIGTEIPSVDSPFSTSVGQEYSSGEFGSALISALPSLILQRRICRLLEAMG